MSLAELFYAKHRRRPLLQRLRRRLRGGHPARARRKVLFEPLEPRILLSADPLEYAVGSGLAADITVRLDAVHSESPVVEAVPGAPADDAIGPNATVPWADLQSLLAADDDGAFAIRVAVTYPGGTTAISDPATLTVTNTAPTATLTNDGPIDEGDAVTVTVENQFDPSGADSAAGFRYSYDFDDDGVFEIADSGAASVVVPGEFRNDAGTHTVRALIRDKDGGATELHTDVTVGEVAPTLVLTGADEAAEGAPYVLELHASDPGDDTVSVWAVDWNDGTIEFLSGPTQSLTHAFADDGTYVVSVRAVDEDGIYAATKTVTVANVAPELRELSAAATGEQALAHLTGTIVEASLADTFTLVVDWGDGATETVALAAGVTTFDVTHRYANDDPSGTPADDYLITATVNNDEGAEGAAATTVTVSNTPPTIAALGVASFIVEESDLVSLIGLIADVGTRDTHSVMVSWGDGLSSAATVDPVTRMFTATHRYAADDPTGTSADLYAAVGVDDRGLDAPLVVFGDTSQDGGRYTGTPGTIRPGVAWSFDNPGGDTIDASAATRSAVLYGGPGADTLFGSQAGDHLAGGSGGDVIHGQGGDDHAYGDTGFNVDLVTRDLTVPIVNASTHPSHDDLAPGEDEIHGDGGDDIVFGDYGVITQAAGTDRILTTGDVVDFRVALETTGAADVLSGDDGRDRIFGGQGGDTIDGGDDDDELVGGLGRDALVGGAGHDVLIGDVGFVVQEGPGAHREVLLVDVGMVTGSHALGGLVATEALATELVGADLVVLAGAYGADGARRLDAAGRWDVRLLTVALEPDGDDTLEGGDGDDLLFGGRGEDSLHGNRGNDFLEGGTGDDVLDGGDGNDIVVGDVSTVATIDGPAPSVAHGLRVLGAGGTRDDLTGTTLLPWTTVVPGHEIDALGGVLRQALGGPEVPVENWLPAESDVRLAPLACVVPDLAHHLELLAGNDILIGGAGDDLMTGDDLHVFARPVAVTEALLARTQAMAADLLEAGHRFGDLVHALHHVVGDHGGEHLRVDGRVWTRRSASGTTRSTGATAPTCWRATTRSCSPRR